VRGGKGRGGEGRGGDGTEDLLSETLDVVIGRFVVVGGHCVFVVCSSRKREFWNVVFFGGS